MRKYLFLGVSLAVFSFAFDAQAETLHDAVDKAISSHPTLKRAKLGAQIAGEDIKEKESAYFPTISATASGGRLYADNSTSRGLSVTRGAGYSWLWEGNASLSQTIFDWNERGNRVDSAKAQHMSAIHSLEDARQTIAYRAVQSYIGLFRAQELHENAVENLAKMKDYKARITKLVDGGGADEAEQSRAGDMVLAAENVLADLKGQLLAAEAGFIEAVGEKPNGELVPPPMPFVINSDEDLNALIEKIQKAHPQVKAMQETIEALDYTALAESKDPLPELGSELSYTKRDQRDLIGGESKDARAMLRLSWNLDTGGAQFARARKARLQQQEAVAQLEELRRTLERNIRVSLAGLEIAREQRDIQKKRRAELTTTFETYEKQFEASKRRLIEVMQADSQVFVAENDYLTSEYSMLDAAYGFLTSQGELTDAIAILSIINEERAPVEQEVEQDALSEDMAALQPVETGADIATLSETSPAAGAPLESEITKIDEKMASVSSAQSSEREEMKSASHRQESIAAVETKSAMADELTAFEGERITPVFAEKTMSVQEQQDAMLSAVMPKAGPPFETKVEDTAAPVEIETSTQAVIEDASPIEAELGASEDLAVREDVVKTFEFVPFKTRIKAEKAPDADVADEQ